MTGAFRHVVPGRNYEDGMASVYAEFARRRGWLKPDGVLTSGAYDALKGRARQWAGEDRTKRAHLNQQPGRPGEPGGHS
ncbi:hypothetical protein [Streptomyces antibioticus]|uniref:hypothetical protein n=1 Tax=Streptomyces antibioticus TaxID=1890 RepID=UPI0033FF666E